MPFLLKRFLFRLHWITGLTAGAVLAVVGVTGGLIGFEQPLLDMVNPQTQISAPAQASPLPPDTLIAAAQAAYPGLRPSRLGWNGDDRAAMVRMAEPGQRRGGLRVAVDPYSGEVLGPLRGTGFFHVAEDLHRRLAAGRVGKQIVGASTALLILLVVTGLVLRWPKHMRSLRAWLKLDVRLRGRNLLWHLHAIFGTWVLAFYLLAALTGLWWSYDFYRDALNGMAGVSGSLRPRAPPPGNPDDPLVPVDTAWATFRHATPDAERAVISLTRNPDAAIRIRYQTPSSAHERAWDTLKIDPLDGAILASQHYADQPRGRRFIRSLYPLHAGSFFGKPGLYLMSLASLLMPLFFITGVWLWLQRRRMAARTRREHLPAATTTGEPVLVLHASQSGTAERLARRTAGWLQQAGLAPRVLALDAAGGRALDQHDGRALFVVSSYGDGGPPDSALGFVRRYMRNAEPPDLSHLGCAVLALGNRRYDVFCGFGHALSRWLTACGSKPLFGTVEAHEAEPAAIEHWHAQLQAQWPSLAGSDVAAPAAARAESFVPWRVIARRELNPGSDAAPLVALDLAPPEDAPAWQPGDLLELYVTPTPERIDAWLRQRALDPAAPVMLDGERLPLREALARREPLPPAHTGPATDAQALVDALPALVPRSYSIASLPDDGHARLLVRQTEGGDGDAGLASGRLCDAATPPGVVDARLRTCPHFHAPSAHVPLLMIANGVGIAPFLGVLQQRAQGPHGEAWLIYGERERRHDGHQLATLQGWRAGGALARLDVCFSRDGDGYVQDCLARYRDELAAWLDRGGHVMVCGSPAMGAGVHAVLKETLGADNVEALHADGRYRRELF